MCPNESNFENEALSLDEKKRFDRQLRLPGWNQALLKKSTVLIVGVGGLGVETAKNLAMVGVGHLILVDLDTIEYSNFNRQILFVGAPEGASKAEYAAKKLREINPFITIDAYNMPLQDLPPEIYHQADIYIAGLDSVEARVELNRRAVHNRKPLLDAGTAAYNGHVYCVWPFKNACLECDPLLERQQDELGACTLVGHPRKPGHCILKGQLQFEQDHGRPADIYNHDEVQIITNIANELLAEYFPGTKSYANDDVVKIIDNHEPTVITINCVMAALESQEAVKILHHIHGREDQKLGSLQYKFVIYNGLTSKFYELEKPPNPKCGMCGSQRTPVIKVKGKSKYPLKEIITKVAEKANLKLDPEFPPTVFRIDSSELQEIEPDQTLAAAGIRNMETLYVTGFEDEKEIYIQIKLEN